MRSLGLILLGVLFFNSCEFKDESGILERLKMVSEDGHERILILNKDNSFVETSGYGGKFAAYGKWSGTYAHKYDLFLQYEGNDNEITYTILEDSVFLNNIE